MMRSGGRHPRTPSQRGFPLAIGALAAALVGCASRLGTADSPGSAVDGRKAYERACASCHGTSGRGDGSAASGLSKPVPDLTTLADRNGGRYPAAYVIGVVGGERALAAHGTREMPVWGRQFDAKAGTIVAVIHAERWADAVSSYVEALQRHDATSDSR